jgi:hypothetical protein
MNPARPRARTCSRPSTFASASKNAVPWIRGLTFAAAMTAAAMVGASCQGGQMSTTSGRESSASSRIDGGGCRPLTEETRQFNDWDAARATLCRPSDEWPRNVSATEACSGYRLLTVSETDTSTEYFFTGGSGILVGVAHRDHIGVGHRVCFGEAPAVRLESCPSYDACANTPKKP